MTATEQIKAAQQDDLISELVPPLTLTQVRTVEERVGRPLPEELRALLAFCSGIEEGCGFEIDFTGERMAFEYEEVFPNGLPVAHDRSGNFWVLDITPDTTNSAPVFFACHDAPVILYQSPDIASFLAEIFREDRSSIDDVAGDRLFNVWRTNPGVIDHAVACDSSDASIRAFALELSENFQIIDLRKVSPGMGFAWGRYGPRTEIRRHGYERIFAYAKPAAKGFLSKLFGR